MNRRQRSGLARSDGLVEILPNLFWYRDTCNVYLLKDGDHGLLIDFGSGGVLDDLDLDGAVAIDWVLHTHHHRDQCQGDYRLNELHIPIAVPEREAGLFENVEAFWRQRRIYDNYDVSSSVNALPRPVRISRALKDYARFSWRGYSIDILPSPGHTRGSISLLTTVGGSGVAFVGDLIAAPGALDTIHDLQWQYNTPAGIGAALHSVRDLASRRIDWLMPSHGRPMPDAPTALAQLATNLDRLYRLQADISAHRVWRSYPHVLEQDKLRLSDHLWANPHSVANSYALVTDAGNGMLLDYGYPSWDHFYADLRFVGHSLDDLEAVAGLRSVDVVVPSHYHDDHLAGVPWLQRTRGTQAWIFEAFSEIVANPSGFNVPCLLEEPIRVDRVLTDGESFEWEGFRFEAFHMPGHTWWAGGLFAEIDGLRIGYTGDNIFAGTAAPLRAGGPIYRNKVPIGSFARGIRQLMDHRPEMLLTGHGGAIEVSRAALDGLYSWAKELDGAFMSLVAVPEDVDFALDPNFATLYPYHTTIGAGSTFHLQLRVTNHGGRDRAASAELVAPEGWVVSGPGAVATGRRVDVPASGIGVLEFDLSVPSDASGRHIVCADLQLGERRWGLVAEAVVDVKENEQGTDRALLG